jgi:hypothetical protein
MELVGRLKSNDLTKSHEGGGRSGSDNSLGSFSLELASSLGYGHLGRIRGGLIKGGVIALRVCAEILIRFI